MKTAKAGRARRRGILRRWRVKPARLVVAMLIFYVLVVLSAQQVEYYRAGRRVSELRAAIAVERERTVLLEAEIAYRESDEFIEHIARRELGLVYPGEIPIVSGVRP